MLKRGLALHSLGEAGRFVLMGGMIALAFCAPAFAGTITRITVAGKQHQAAITVITSGGESLQVKGFTLTNPPRIVFDLPAALAKGAPAIVGQEQAFALRGGPIKQVRLGQFSTAPDIARIVVDLSVDSKQSDLKWEAKKGPHPGETVLVVRWGGAVTLAQPIVKREADCVLVRVQGAGALKREVGALDKPYRIYVDIEGAAAKRCDAGFEQAPLHAVRLGPQPEQDGQSVARVVVELTKKQAYNVFAEGPDLVIAVGPHEWGLPLPAYAATGRLKGKTVVVDAGHGGNDIGAPAAFGAPPGEPYEKGITLDIAQRLTKVLKAEGASVTMTRSDDTFVPLQERAAVANKLKADAFISIHCNSCEDPNTLCGTSVYYDHPHSERFAELVQGDLIAALATVDKGVRNANFAVIRRTTGPGILVETAFINHQDDRALLVNANAQERMARAIVQGLAEYLRRSDPPACPERSRRVATSSKTAAAR